MARVISLGLILILVLTGCSSGGSPITSSFFATKYNEAHSDNTAVTESETSTQTQPAEVKLMYQDVCFTKYDRKVPMLDDFNKCKSGLIFNVNTTEILYTNNLHEKVFPASTTKLMTALVAIKHTQMDDMVTIDEDDCGIVLSGAQLCHFKKGDKISMQDLLYCLLVYSGNDAALAIAKHISGSEREFAHLMNDQAKELGCTNTNFVNPHGLHDPNHYTTAYDMYLIFNECLKYDALKTIFKTEGYTVTIYDMLGSAREIQVEPTNMYFLGKYKAPEGIHVYGGKTGDTIAAGKCIVLYSEDYDGQGFITELFGAEDRDILYNEMNLLFSYILQSNP